MYSFVYWSEISESTSVPSIIFLVILRTSKVVLGTSIIVTLETTSLGSDKDIEKDPEWNDS